MSERVVVVNAGKMNYDHALDFSILSNDVQVYLCVLLNTFSDRPRRSPPGIRRRCPCDPAGYCR